MHLKRVGSLADAAIWLLYAEELILHKIGAGLAAAKGLDKKHTTKQIDRLLSNKNLIFGKKVALGHLILLVIVKRLLYPWIGLTLMQMANRL